MNQIKELAKTIHLNYDMPKEFAEDLAVFLYDEGYGRVIAGEWIKTLGRPPYCSLCKEPALLRRDGENNCMSTYCPSCGAYMHIEED